MWRDPQSTNDKEPEAAKSTKVSTTRIELRSNANEMTANLPLASYGKIFRCARASEGFGNLRARRAAPTSQLPVVRASWFVLLWVLWANSSEKSTVHDVRAPRTRKIETRGGQKDATRGGEKKKRTKGDGRRDTPFWLPLLENARTPTVLSFRARTTQTHERASLLPYHRLLATKKGDCCLLVGYPSMATAAQRNRKEVSHYVVTAFPPGAVLHTACCTNFTSEASTVRLWRVLGWTRKDVPRHQGWPAFLSARSCFTHTLSPHFSPTSLPHDTLADTDRISSWPNHAAWRYVQPLRRRRAVASNRSSSCPFLRKCPFTVALPVYTRCLPPMAVAAGASCWSRRNAGSMPCWDTKPTPRMRLTTWRTKAAPIRS